jgi:hypothetical protein
MNVDGVEVGQLGAFVKSSGSNTPDTHCVEVAVSSTGHRVVRNSNRRDGAVVPFTAGEWAAFLVGVERGEFDIEV